jgi:thioredoxin-dependent adenylylsulfate APS reductase
MPVSEGERASMNDVAVSLSGNALAGASAEDVLRWAIERIGQGLVLVTSFQAEGMVLLDMAWRIDPSIRVLTIDTGRLPDETYALMDEVRERYGIAIEVIYPDAQELEPFVRAEGVNAFYRAVELRRRCCAIRKVAPLKRALAGADAWISGQRREHAETRRAIGTVERDAAHGGIVKLNPLADWTTAQVWDYIEAHDVPRNALYAQGYTSIGCAPCTRATAPGEDPRAGRWWWEADAAKECGIHLPQPQNGVSLWTVNGGPPHMNLAPTVADEYPRPSTTGATTR